MNKSVTISCDEQGQYSVGEDAMGGLPGEGEAPDAMGGPQPVESLDAALDMARQLLSASPDDAEAEAGFQKGFASENAATGLDQYIKRGV